MAGAALPERAVDRGDVAGVVDRDLAHQPALLAAGANVNARDERGRTPLHSAVWGRKRVPRGLCEARGGASRIALALHEAVEVTLVVRLRPNHPHVRWFTDGYADALTVHLLGEHVGESAVASFLAGRDIEQFADPRQEINLLSWLAKQAELELMSVEAEQRLALARYRDARGDGADRASRRRSRQAGS